MFAGGCYSMKKTYIVGIAGGSSSGKTTFTNKLVNVLSDLDIYVFHMDDYFKDEEGRPHTPSHITGIVYIDDNHPLTMDLPKLAEDIEAAININKYDVIIVEGLLTLQDNKIYSMLNLKLFVDCRADERIVRRLKRNMAWGESFDEVTGVYLDMVRFRHDEYVEASKWRADFIMNGTLESEKALSIIADAVKSACYL